MDPLPPYLRVLRGSELDACHLLGKSIKVAHDINEELIKQSDIGDTVKDIVDSGWYGALALSVMGGIPLGIAAHAIGNGIKDTSAKEQELINTRKHYANATHSLESAIGSMRNRGASVNDRGVL